MPRKAPKLVFRPSPAKPTKSTGKPRGRPEIYPFSKLEVGEFFIIEREGNHNPSYEACYQNVAQRNRRSERKYTVTAEKFPQLIITRTA